MNRGAIQVGKAVGRILLVDDQPFLLDSFKRFLERGGYAVETAADLEAARALALEGRFDVLFVDLLWGDELLGLDWIGRLRGDPRTARLPIVAITGHGEKLLTEAKERGANAGREKVHLCDDALTLIQGLVTQRLACAPVVLHLEDDTGWAEMVRSWLAIEAYILRRASNRKELLELLEQDTRIDLVLMDVGLAAEDGLSILRALKSAARLKRVPVVVHSTREDLATKAHELGAVTFVPKAHSKERLVAAVAAVIAQDERSRGVVEDGDLRLDPRGGLVLLDGRFVTSLERPWFALLSALVEASPKEVSDEFLWATVEQRHGRVNAVHARTLANYVALLHRMVGPIIARRIRRVRGSGYRYLP